MSRISSLQIKHVLCCDLVRMESSGKEMLLGVYNQAIVMKDLPGFLPGLFFRLESKVGGDVDADFVCSFVGPKGEVAGQIAGHLKVDYKRQGGDGLIHVPIAPIHLATPGIHCLHFALGKRKPRKVFEIDVRLPKPGDPTFPQAQPASGVTRTAPRQKRKRRRTK